MRCGSRGTPCTWSCDGGRLSAPRAMDCGGNGGVLWSSPRTYRTRTRTPSPRRIGEATGTASGGLLVLDDEDDLARANEAEFFARERFDRGRILFQAPDVVAQAGVLVAQGGN